MAAVGTLTNLTSLSFGLGREPSYLEQIAALTKLKHLYMENCHFLEGTMEVFSDFRNLELLEIQNCWCVRILPSPLLVALAQRTVPRPHPDFPSHPTNSLSQRISWIQRNHAHPDAP